MNRSNYTSFFCVICYNRNGDYMNIKKMVKTMAIVTIFSTVERLLGFVYRILLSRSLGEKNYENVNDNKVREAHGKLASFVGVFSNLFSLEKNIIN